MRGFLYKETEFMISACTFLCTSSNLTLNMPEKIFKILKVSNNNWKAERGIKC